MKNLKKTFWPVIAAVALMGLVFNFTACSTNSPLSTTEENFFAENNMQFIELGESLSSLQKGNFQVSELITPEEGGELTLAKGAILSLLSLKEDIENVSEDSLEILGFGKQSGFLLTLTVLPKSILEPTVLSLEMDQKSFDMEFSPHGTQFQTPALFSLIATGLKLKEVNTATLNVYYDNPETGQWEIMEGAIVTVSKRLGYLQILGAQIPHFSRYAVAWSKR